MNARSVTISSKCCVSGGGGDGGGARMPTLTGGYKCQILTWKKECKEQEEGECEPVRGTCTVAMTLTQRSGVAISLSAPVPVHNETLISIASRF